MKFIFKLCAILLCTYSQMAISVGNQPAPKLGFSLNSVNDLLEKIEEGQINKDHLDSYQNQLLITNEFNLEMIENGYVDRIKIGETPQERLAHLVVTLEAWQLFELKTKQSLINRCVNTYGSKYAEYFASVIKNEIHSKPRIKIRSHLLRTIKTYQQNENLKSHIVYQIEKLFSNMKNQAEESLEKYNFRSSLRPVIYRYAKSNQFSVVDSLQTQKIQGSLNILSRSLNKRMEEPQIQEILDSLLVPNSDDPIAGFFLKIVKRIVEVRS